MSIRAILDLRRCNMWMKKLSFGYRPWSTWCHPCPRGATSIDLANAYFHISMRPSHCRVLSSLCQETSVPSTSKFGLLLAWRVFTKTLVMIIARLRLQVVSFPVWHSDQSSIIISTTQDYILDIEFPPGTQLHRVFWVVLFTSVGLHSVKFRMSTFLQNWDLNKLERYRAGGKTDAQRGEVTCPRPHRSIVEQPGIEPRTPDIHGNVLSARPRCLS